MASLVLHVGDRNLSSWSLRPWLALKVAGIPFETHAHALHRPTTSAELAAVSPTARIPALHIPPAYFAGATLPPAAAVPALAGVAPGTVVVWDSLAILEWAAETRPSLWPASAAARAVARSVSAEMHSGFAALREHMSMNITGSVPYDAAAYPAAVHADVARIVALWADCRTRFGVPAGTGPFLFGAFTAADAMYAPVVTRFRTYNVPLPQGAQEYADAIWALPAMQEWVSAAKAEVAAAAKA